MVSALIEFERNVKISLRNRPTPFRTWSASEEDKLKARWPHFRAGTLSGTSFGLGMKALYDSVCKSFHALRNKNLK
jgi:hypothetical protein